MLELEVVMSEKNVPNTPELKRQGTRRNAGADTPSGPNTDRTSIPAKREHKGKDPSEIMPSASPETIKDIDKGKAAHRL
jgi:hypothetical protein